MVKIKDIVEILSKNEEFGHKFTVSEGFWEKATEIVEVLQIPYASTIESQRVGYGLSDFYISWLRMKKGLERCEQTATLNLASMLLKCLEARAPSLFDTPLMLCSIYLDPRISFKLSVAQKRDAALALAKFYDRFEKLNATEKNGSINDTLDEIQAEFRLGSNQQDSNTTAFFNSLAQFETEKPSDIRAPVMSFWQTHGHKYPLIKPVAEVLLSVPANQCCTERAFSSFTYLRSAHRQSMNPKNLSNILMVRLNKNLFYDFRKENIERLKNE